MSNFLESCAALQSGRSQFALLLTEWPEEHVVTSSSTMTVNNSIIIAASQCISRQVGLNRPGPSQSTMPAASPPPQGRSQAWQHDTWHILLLGTTPAPGPAWGRRPAGPGRWASGAPLRCEAGSPRPPQNPQTPNSSLSPHDVTLPTCVSDRPGSTCRAGAGVQNEADNRVMRARTRPAVPRVPALPTGPPKSPTSASGDLIGTTAGRTE